MQLFAAENNSRLTCNQAHPLKMPTSPSGAKDIQGRTWNLADPPQRGWSAGGEATQLSQTGSGLQARVEQNMNRQTFRQRHTLR